MDRNSVRAAKKEKVAPKTKGTTPRNKKGGGSSKGKPVVFKPDSEEPVLVEETLTREFLENGQQRSGSGNGSRSRSPSPVYLTVRIWKQRVLAALLGSLLPILDLKFNILYFVAWEIGMVGLFGGIPLPPHEPNMVITILIMLGLDEREIRRVKLFCRLSRWLSVDFCFFMASLLFSQFMVGLYFELLAILEKDGSN